MVSGDRDAEASCIGAAATTVSALRFGRSAFFSSVIFVIVDGRTLVHFWKSTRRSSDSKIETMDDSFALSENGAAAAVPVARGEVRKRCSFCDPRDPPRSMAHIEFHRACGKLVWEHFDRMLPMLDRLTEAAKSRPTELVHMELNVAYHNLGVAIGTLLGQVGVRRNEEAQECIRKHQVTAAAAAATAASSSQPPKKKRKAEEEEETEQE
jgi:hypothetical protein